MKIEWCVRNEPLGVRYVIDDLRSHHMASWTFQRYACTEDCELCCRQPFVRMDDQLKLTAEAPNQLYHLILEQLKEDGE